MSSASGGLQDYSSQSQQARLAEGYRMGEGRVAASMWTDATGWAGWVLFAAVIMMLLGTFHAIQGLVALFKDEYFAVDTSRLVLSVGYTTWGIVHVVFGVILVIAGISL